MTYPSQDTHHQRKNADNSGKFHCRLKQFSKQPHAIPRFTFVMRSMRKDQEIQAKQPLPNCRGFRKNERSSLGQGVEN